MHGVSTMTERRYDIDWLRIFGIAMLFPFHAARVFDVFEPNYVKNAIWQSMDQASTTPGFSWPLSLFIFFTAYWFMPLLFWLAGSSSWYALQKRDGGQYARERVARLLVPFLFGLVVIVPPQGYMARLMQGYQGGYLNYLLGYFTDFSDLSGYYGTFTPAHLWFILYLFVISLCVLPLMLAIRKRVLAANDGGKPFWLARQMEKPAVFLALLPVLLTITEALPDIGGKNPFYYAALFLIGYLAACSKSVLAMLNRLRFPALLTLPAVLALLTLMQFQWGFGNHPDLSVPQAAMAITRNLALILTMTVLLGYGNRLLNKNTKTLTYLSRAAFPVYILHQTVMMVAAFFVVQWALPVWGKFSLIIVLSFAATLALYELVVRRVGFLKALFGLK